MRSEAVEMAIAGLSSKATYTGGALSFVWGVVSSNGFATFTGAVLMIATFWVNSHYRRKAEKREHERMAREAAAEARAQELHALRMEALRRGLDVYPDVGSDS